MRSALALVTVLAGCASNQAQTLPILTPQEASQMSVASLCLGLSTFRPVNAQTAQFELTRRGVNCADHAAAVQALQQQDAQLMGIILQQRATAPQPVYIPPVTYPITAPTPQVTCTSQWVMGQYRTVCR